MWPDRTVHAMPGKHEIKSQRPTNKNAMCLWRQFQEHNCIVPSVAIRTRQTLENHPILTTVLNSVICLAIIDPLLGPSASMEQQNRYLQPSCTALTCE